MARHNTIKSGSQSPVSNQTQKVELLTRKEVGNIFKISLVTVDKWAAIALLKSYRIGTRVFFKRHEIDAALTLIPSKKGGANG